MTFAKLLVFASMSATLLAQTEPDVSIQIDGSGSMDGFRGSGQLQSLVPRLLGLVRKARLTGEAVFFVTGRDAHQTNWEPWDSYLGTPGWGQSTHLDWAYESGRLRAPIVVLLTDNVQESDGVEDTRALYAHFNGEQVKQLRAIPLRLPFQGRIANPLSGPSALAELRRVNPDARISDLGGGRVFYDGERGLIAYLYLTDEAKTNDFHTLLGALAGDKLPAILLKPLGPAIVLRSGQTSSQIEGKLDERQTVEFDFTLESQFEHVNILPGVGEKVRFEVTRPSVLASPPQDGVFFGGAMVPGHVNPPTLQGELKNKQTSSFKYRCFAQLGPFEPNTEGFFDSLRLARLGPVFADFFFEVQMKIPSDSFNMTPEFADEHFTKTRGRLDRVYSPVDLVSFLHPEGLTVTPRSGRVQGRLKLAPPLYPFAYWLLLLAPLAVVPLAGAWIWRKPFKYLFNEEPRLARMRPFGGRFDLEYETAGGEKRKLAGVVRSTLSRHVLKPAEGVTALTGWQVDAPEWEPGGGAVPPETEPLPGRAEGESAGEPSQGAEPTPATPDVVLEKNQKVVLRHAGNRFVFEWVSRHDGGVGGRMAT